MSTKQPEYYPEEILRRLLGEVTEKLTNDLRDVLVKKLEEELSSALTNALVESEFYRKVNGDMRNGLKNIYQKINAASDKTEPQGNEETRAIVSKQHADKLFSEASEQLTAVLEQTKTATDSIMVLIEKHMTLQAETEELLRTLHVAEEAKPTYIDVEKIERLDSISAQLGEDLLSMMLSLSFQDLTGQRIQRAVTSLKEIEATVVEMYLSTGLLIQAYEDEPTRNLDEIEAETREKVTALKEPDSILSSSLKGPSTTGSSQAQIDDLLAQLGM